MTGVVERRIGYVPKVFVYPDGPQLVASVAGRLATRVAALQAEKGTASVVLTGGRTGIALLAELTAGSGHSAVDWSRVDFFWGDDRFVSSDNPDRNARQAYEALLDHLPVDPRRVHVMEPANGRFGYDPDAAAAAYEELLVRYGDATGGPLFDICLLGVGEEGHVASVFPDSPAVHEERRMVVAVRDCPKPPPTRISLTLPTIRRSDQVWLITTGAAKAEAVAAAVCGADQRSLPAAGARGLDCTLWFVDAEAARGLSRR
ncbi:6-phosphogluconolactonase [Planosporangium flavigriseum]|uniref:6-phosphogluconolactonase n=1 Tax=Planosporangium flavigriseum TaxID=373681 RepID=A0A8J3PPR8_9ACTN|nr:6-phosphogluconolactonase [Planosporangium flavigriseum]NJC67530.1 6-phosphogluconolactonase [Planosporangium flavigriseum]GIG76654.1 6-phosphogluconolactonase [Planosporangium flavigriseum]